MLAPPVVDDLVRMPSEQGGAGIELVALQRQRRSENRIERAGQIAGRSPACHGLPRENGRDRLGTQRPVPRTGIEILQDERGLDDQRERGGKITACRDTVPIHPRVERGLRLGADAVRGDRTLQEFAPKQRWVMRFDEARMVASRSIVAALCGARA